MPLSQEAENARPKQPQNAYFQFRTDKLVELKDDPDRVQKIKGLWENIDPELKKQLEDEFQAKKEQHKHDVAAWMAKFHLTEDDLKEHKKEKADQKKSKKRDRDTEDEEDRKPVKTKGAKETREEKKKREEEAKKKEEAELRRKDEEEKAKSRNASKTLDKGKSKKEEGKGEKKKAK